MFYRVKQFMCAITARLNEADEAFIREHLEEDEEELFKQLRVYEQKHCIVVAKGLESALPIEKGRELIKMGLLHDIGKIKYPLNPIEKSVMVILDKVTKGKVKALRHLKMVKCYYGHAAMSYELLKATGKYDEAFLEIIRKHHEKGYTTNEKLRLLQKYDNLA